MISKCANPACPTRFLYLHEGRLFRVEREAEETEPVLGFDPTTPKHARSVEFFWLCGNCAATMTLTYRKGVGVTTRQVRPFLKAAS